MSKGPRDPMLVHASGSLVLQTQKSLKINGFLACPEIEARRKFAEINLESESASNNQANGKLHLSHTPGSKSSALGKQLGWKMGLLSN